MSTFLITLVLIAAPSENVAVVDSSLADELRPYHEIGRDVRAAMKREATAESDDARARAIHAMTRLYLEVKRDPRLPLAPTIKRYKDTLWSRLTKIKTDLQRQIDREAEARQRATPEELAELLAAQQARQTANRATESLANQFALVSSSLGGPARVFAATGTGFGGGMVRDHGEELVELIERTISPEFWDTVGGPGSIFYYAPLRVLVVSATLEVHWKIGGAVGGLRRAGH